MEEELLQKIEKSRRIKKGEHHSPYTEFKKGATPWNKGKKGLYASGMKGKKHTKGAKMKMSESHKRNPAKYWLGKKMSLELRKKLSEIHKKNPTRYWLGKKGPFTGEKSNLWKGGKMKNYSENKQIRLSLEYKLWRKAVFERDKFTCQKTGEKGGELVAHHINNFEDFPELRLAIDNGITLSKKAHKEFHKKYGVKNNTREQLEEFLK